MIRPKVQFKFLPMDKASHLSSPRPGGEAGPSLVTQKNNSTMSQERFKGLRDQTLVLRVLVPGLHTSLNDKINSKKNGGDDTLSLSWSCEASGGGPQKIGNGSERLLNLEGVTCLPSQSDSTLWDFR